MSHSKEFLSRFSNQVHKLGLNYKLGPKSDTQIINFQNKIHILINRNAPNCIILIVPEIINKNLVLTIDQFEKLPKELLECVVEGLTNYSTQKQNLEQQIIQLRENLSVEFDSVRETILHIIS